MKKSVSILLCICIALSLSVPAFAIQETRDIEVTYRGVSITLDGAAVVPVDADGYSVEPFIYDGTTYLPVRGIANALRLGVEWNNETSTVVLTSGGTPVAPLEAAKSSHATVTQSAAYRDIKITIDGTELVPKDVSGNVVEPFIIDGTTYLPVRAISEALKLSVAWDDSTSTVILSSAEKPSEASYKVLRVVDGDTIEVDFNGVEEKVRMIGIDTPESVHPDSDKNTEAGITASEYTKSMLEGKYVTLEFDVQERDMYGRLLAYVYLDGVMFNETLLEEGYAELATYPPNVKYVDRFTEIANRVHGGGNPGGTGDGKVPVKTSGTYVASIESDKYHNPACRQADRITDENRTWFDTAEEAASYGYSPCGICQP